MLEVGMYVLINNEVYKIKKILHRDEERFIPLDFVSFNNVKEAFIYCKNNYIPMDLNIILEKNNKKFILFADYYFCNDKLNYYYELVLNDKIIKVNIIELDIKKCECGFTLTKTNQFYYCECCCKLYDKYLNKLDD